MANRQVAFTAEDGTEIRIYGSHALKCEHKVDASFMKCGCWKWMQYQQNGKQVKETTRSRSIVGANEAAKKKGLELSGKVPAPEPKAVTVEAAVGDWLKFREKNGSGNHKAELMGRKLTEWGRENGVVFLHEATTEKVGQFRDSLPYKTRTSGSLRVYRSMMANFFGWAAGCRAGGMPNGISGTLS
jgi:hypothetical protein